MTAITHWINERRTIVVHEFIGKWVTEEFESEILGATPDIERCGEPVAVVLNFLQYTMPARQVNIFALVRRFTERRPANIGIIILVVRDAFAYSLVTVVRKVLPGTNIIHATRSMDDALELITKHTEIR
jgi:hypothetical protein